MWHFDQKLLTLSADISLHHPKSFTAHFIPCNQAEWIILALNHLMKIVSGIFRGSCLTHCGLIGLGQHFDLMFLALTKLGELHTHDDVIKWKHFSRYLPFVRGIQRSPVNSAHKVQWRGALMLSLICALNKRLSKQSWSWWFETPSRPLRRHCNVLVIIHIVLTPSPPTAAYMRLRIRSALLFK